MGEKGESAAEGRAGQLNRSREQSTEKRRTERERKRSSGVGRRGTDMTVLEETNRLDGERRKRRERATETDGEGERGGFRETDSEDEPEQKASGDVDHRGVDGTAVDGDPNGIS